MAMTNNPNRPAVFIDADEITPHDSNANQFCGIYVGGTGNLSVRTRAGTAVVFESIPAGSYIPIAVDRVYSSSPAATTATKLVGYKQ